MSQKFQYTTVNRLLAKYHRDFRGIDVNETDAIEWIGEALGFMQMANVQEEAVAFVEVKNYQCDIPNGLHYIIQIARNNKVDQRQICASDIVQHDDTLCVGNGGSLEECLVARDCQGNLIGDYEATYYRPYFDLQYEYFNWNNSSYRQETFTTVRLSNHTFFNSLVCREPNEDIYETDERLRRGHGIYQNELGDEYTIVDDQLRFSFKEGFIAIAYLRQKVDPQTGYPMVPDDISALTAINYYIGWKIKERMCWMNREGACQHAQKLEQSWLKYVNQFKNKAMMPTGVDDYQDLMEQSRYLIPRFNRYYGFFGKLGKKEDRVFNDPDHRKKVSLYSGYGRQHY